MQLIESRLSDSRLRGQECQLHLQLPPPPPDPQDLPVLQLLSAVSFMQATPRSTSPQSSSHPSPECGSCHPKPSPIAIWSQLAPSSPRHLPKHLSSNPLPPVLPGTWAATSNSFSVCHCRVPSWSAWQVGETTGLEFKSQFHHLLRPVTSNLLAPASRVC